MKERSSVINVFLICFLISLLLGCGLIFTSNSNLQFINVVFLWNLGILYLAIIIYAIFLKRCFAKFLKIRRKGRKIIIILLSVVIVAVAFKCLPFSITNVTKNNFLKKEVLGKTNVVITALGEKNDRSKGYEVWLEGVKVDKTDYNLYEINLEKGWDWNDGRPFYEENKKSSISFTINAKDRCVFLTRKGPNMGKVKVQIGKISTVYDLYSAHNDDRYKLDLEKMVNVDNLYSKMDECIYDVCYLIILWILSFIISFNTLAFALREQKLKVMEEKNDCTN